MLHSTTVLKQSQFRTNESLALSGKGTEPIDKVRKASRAIQMDPMKDGRIREIFFEIVREWVFLLMFSASHSFCS